MCHQPLEDVAPEQAGIHFIPAPGPARGFHLNSLMLVIALVAIVLGVWRAAWGLGILVAIVAVPASLRTWGMVAEKHAHNQPVRLDEKILAFLGSIGVVLAIGLAAIIAFYGTCLVAVGLGSFGSATGNYDLSIIFFFGGIGLGILVAIFAGILVARLLWKRRS
jgi:hypothetical protein